MPRRFDARLLAQPFTRRSVVEWLGAASVAPLGVPLLAACGEEEPLALADCDTGDFPFEPGSASPDIYRDWRVRTVDPQDAAALLEGWQLEVDGLVETPLALSFADLVAREQRQQITDFHCVEGWSVLDVPWIGVHLSTLFELAGVKAEASHVTFHCAEDVYVENIPIDVALEPRTLLAYGVGCATLPLDRGFPARLVVPRLFGYKNPKSVKRIELTDRRVDGYWVALGYPYEAEVQEERLREGRY